MTQNCLLAAAAVLIGIGETMSIIMLMMIFMKMTNIITKQKIVIVVLINGLKQGGCTSLTVAANLKIPACFSAIYPFLVDIALCK